MPALRLSGCSTRLPAGLVPPFDTEPAAEVVGRTVNWTVPSLAPT